MFVSYAREDTAFVRRLVAALEQRNRSAWVDWELTPGDRWRDSVREQIDAADVFLFTLSPDSAVSNECKVELEYARQEQKHVVVVVCRDVNPERVIEELRDLNWVFLRESDDFEAGARALEAALDLNIDFVRLHTRVLTRARAWDLAGRRPSPLLRGEDLRAAQHWLERASVGGQPQPTSLQVEFVRESRRVATRRQRTAVVGSLIVAVVAVVLAVFALIQRSQARHQATVAQSRELAARAETALSSDPENAISLAAQGVRVYATSQAVHALADALAGSRLRMALQTSSPVDAVAFTPDGRTLVVGSQDGAVSLIDLAVRRLTWSQGPGTAPVVSVSVARDARMLVVLRSPLTTFAVVGNADCSVDVLATASGAVERQLGRPGVFASPSCPLFAAFVGASNEVAVGFQSGLVRIYDADSGRLLSSNRGLSAPANSIEGHAYGMAISSSGRTMAAGNDPGYVRVISLPRGRLLDNLNSAVLLKPQALVFAPDGNQIAAGGKYGIEVDGLANGLVGPTAELAVFGVPGTIAWSPNGRLIAAGSESGLGYVFSAASSRVIEQLNTGAALPINAVAFSSGDDLATGSQTGQVRIWAPDPDAPEAAIRVNLDTDPSNFFGGSAEGGRLITLGDASEVFVMTADGRLVRRLQPGGSPGDPIAVASRGRLVLARSNRLIELRLPAGQPVGAPVMLTPSSNPTEISASADGRTLATANENGTVTVIGAGPTHTITPRTTTAGTELVALSPDGRLLAVSSVPPNSSQGTVQVYETHGSTVPVHVLAGGRTAFAPSGAELAVQEPDLSIIELATSDWGVRERLAGETQPTDGLAYSPNGDLVVATSDDGILRAWDATDAAPLVTRYVAEQDPAAGLPVGALNVSAPAVTNNGQTLVGLGSPTDEILRYDVCDECLDAHALIAQADARLAMIRTKRVG